MSNLKSRLTRFIGDYGMKEQKGAFAFFMTNIVALITGYNHQKYWQRRAYLLDPTKRNYIWKLYCFMYIKRVDAKHLSSFGTSFNTGSSWNTPPNLPHGLNGIIVGHDAICGSNITMFQRVTISQKGCVIGDNVILGANCIILPGVHIGNNAKVGANCVVVEDVPDGATVVMQKPRIIIKNGNDI